MSAWDKISLFKFQQIEGYNAKDLSDMDKILFSVCAVFNLTEYELNNYPAKKALKLIQRIEKIFSCPFEPKPLNKIGEYYINYDISSMSFGQYVELHFFLQHPTQNAHFILASISNEYGEPNKSEDHRPKSEYFLHQSITRIMGCLKLCAERFAEFNKEYKSLFGLDEAVHTEEARVDHFNKRYGWIYSATQVKDHNGITLDQAFSLPVRQALNDLAYLKALAKYQAEQLKNK